MFLFSFEKSRTKQICINIYIYYIYIYIKQFNILFGDVASGGVAAGKAASAVLLASAFSFVGGPAGSSTLPWYWDLKAFEDTLGDDVGGNESGMAAGLTDITSIGCVSTWSIRIGMVLPFDPVKISEWGLSYRNIDR